MQEMVNALRQQKDRRQLEVKPRIVQLARKNSVVLGHMEEVELDAYQDTPSASSSQRQIDQAAQTMPPSTEAAPIVPSAAAAVSSFPAVPSFSRHISSIPTPVTASQEATAAARIERGQRFTIKNKSTGFSLVHVTGAGVKCGPETAEGNHFWFLERRKWGPRFGNLSGRLYNAATNCWLEHVDGSTGCAATLGWWFMHESWAGDHWWYYWKLEWVDQGCVKIVQCNNRQRWALACGGGDGNVCVVGIQQDAPWPSWALWEVQ